MGSEWDVQSQLTGNVVHHDVHAGELRPDLSEDANVGPVDHLGLEQLKVADISVSSLELDHVSDFLQLVVDEWGVSVTFGVD